MKAGVDFIGVSTPFFCNDGHGLFLLNKRSQNCRDEQGRWEVGAGRLEHGLTAEENVMKEIREEYGCDGVIQEALPVHSLFREADGKKTHWVMIPFLVKVNPAEVKNNEPDKIDELGWFRLDNLPQPLHSGLAYQLTHYGKYFDAYRI